MKSTLIAYFASTGILVAALPALHDGFSERNQLPEPLLLAARQNPTALTWAKPNCKFLELELSAECSLQLPQSALQRRHRATSAISILCFNTRMHPPTSNAVTFFNLSSLQSPGLDTRCAIIRLFSFLFRYRSIHDDSLGTNDIQRCQNRYNNLD